MIAQKKTFRFTSLSFSEIYYYNGFMSEHKHHHDPKEIKKVIDMFARTIGHLESVKKMVEKDEDCSDVLIQLAAVKGELNKISKDILKQHLNHCIVHAIEDNDQEALNKMNEAIEQLIK